jgi:DNA-binding transcriptional regulator YiaG
MIPENEYLTTVSTCFQVFVCVKSTQNKKTINFQALAMNSKTGTDGQMLLSGSLNNLKVTPVRSRSRIREAREAMGVPRIEAANVVGVSLSTFQAWEAGEREPDATKISIYAKKYGLAADWLLFGEGEMRKGSTDR